MTEEIRTLADIRKELFSGTEELYAQFVSSIVEQQSLTPEQSAVVGDYLRDITGKRDRLAAFIESLEAEAEVKRSKVRAIEKQAREFENLAKMFKDSILGQLSNWTAGSMIRRVDGAESSFRIQNNPPRLDIFDRERIPKKYRRYSWEPDKEAIKCAIASGIKVPGCKMADPSTHLEIK